MAHLLAYLLLDPAAQGLIPKKIFRGKIVNVAEVNQGRYLEESGQWLENVVRTQLVPASGKLVLQQNLLCCRCATAGFKDTYALP